MAAVVIGVFGVALFIALVVWRLYRCGRVVNRVTANNSTNNQRAQERQPINNQRQNPPMATAVVVGVPSTPTASYAAHESAPATAAGAVDSKPDDAAYAASNLYGYDHERESQVRLKNSNSSE